VLLNARDRAQRAATPEDVAAQAKRERNARDRAQRAATPEDVAAQAADERNARDRAQRAAPAAAPAPGTNSAPTMIRSRS
jgi:hypothetical protein